MWSRSTDADLSTIGKFSSLAIYGDQDIFASAKKTREWCEALKHKYGSAFSSVEVTGAGHFWVKYGVEKELRSVLRDWAFEGPPRADATTISQH
jgi:surfactin synthase thioesterase subunit